MQQECKAFGPKRVRILLLLILSVTAKFNGDWRNHTLNNDSYRMSEAISYTQQDASIPSNHQERILQATEEQASKAHVVNCYQKSYDNPGSYFFCNPDNVPTKEYSKDYLKYGWCCPTGSIQDVCQDTGSHLCTLPDIAE